MILEDLYTIKFEDLYSIRYKNVFKNFLDSTKGILYYQDDNGQLQIISIENEDELKYYYEYLVDTIDDSTKTLCIYLIKNKKR